jgi:hypothetical protein
MSRGIENKNPLNIRKNDERFKGEVRPSQDPEFKEFLDFSYGYRAAFVLIHTYISKYDLDTIPDIISRWAPGHENPTENYINFVSQKSGISTSEKINYANPDQMTKLVAAMSRFETGEEAIMPDVYEGWTMFKQDRQIKEAAVIGGTGLLFLGALAYFIFKDKLKKLLNEN